MSSHVYIVGESVHTASCLKCILSCVTLTSLVPVKQGNEPKRFTTVFKVPTPATLDVILQTDEMQCAKRLDSTKLQKVRVRK
jgi:hypothetical protein